MRGKGAYLGGLAACVSFAAPAHADTNFGLRAPPNERVWVAPPPSRRGSRAYVDAPVPPISQAARVGAQWGVVTSTYRSPARNRAVGGVPNSYHLSGRAIDIARRSGVSHAQLERAFLQSGYRLIESLDEGDHSHFAFGAPGSAPDCSGRAQQGGLGRCATSALDRALSKAGSASSQSNTSVSLRISLR